MSSTIAFDFGGEQICNCMDILWVDIAKLRFAIVTIFFRHVLFWKLMQGRDLYGCLLFTMRLSETVCELKYWKPSLRGTVNTKRVQVSPPICGWVVHGFVQTNYQMSLQLR